VSNVTGVEVLETNAGEDGEDIRLAVTRAGVQPGERRNAHVLLAGHFQLVDRQVVTRLTHHAVCCHCSRIGLCTSILHEEDRIEDEQKTLSTGPVYIRFLAAVRMDYGRRSEGQKYILPMKHDGTIVE